jgi:hypothetical protein
MLITLVVNGRGGAMAPTQCEEAGSASQHIWPHRPAIPAKQCSTKGCCCLKKVRGRNLHMASMAAMNSMARPAPCPAMQTRHRAGAQEACVHTPEVGGRPWPTSHRRQCRSATCPCIHNSITRPVPWQHTFTSTHVQCILGRTSWKPHCKATGHLCRHCTVTGAWLSR